VTSAPGTPTASATSGAPAGYTLYQDPSGWTIAVPEGWRTARGGDSVTFTDPGAPRSLRIAQRADPPPDPYTQALTLEPVVKAATPGYVFSRITRVKYRGWPTADWEYRAGPQHTLIRNVVPDERTGYTMTWTAPHASWAQNRRVFETAMGTFTPA
jgi:hypothetical protein